jgi:hypothetical protein
MALYLQMNGVNDITVSNSIAYNKVVMDVLVNAPGDTTLRYLVDSLSRGSGGYMRYNGTWANNMSATGLVFGTRTTVTGQIATPYTGWIQFFKSGAGFSGNVYDIKLYNGTTLVGWYDMSTGNVQDQSGNGNHATLTGGTWLDDGVGGTPIIVNSVIANANADAIAPAISTVSSISTSIDVITATITADTLNPTISVSSQISSPFGSATADALNPSVSLSGSISIITVITDVTADASNPGISTDINLLSSTGTAIVDAFSPNVGSFTNISVNAVIVSATADVVSPSVDAIRNISLGVTIADTTAEALASIVGSSASVQITAVIASLTVDGIAPSISVSQGNRIDSVIAGVFADAISPTIQTDAIISVIITELIAAGMAPALNSKFIIGIIRLKGQRVLNVILKGKRELNVILKGRRIQNVVLKGSVGMTAKNQNFSMTAGDSFEPIFPCTDLKYNETTKQMEEVPLDLIGCTAKWGLRQKEYATTNLLMKTETAGITLSGDTVKIKLDPLDTATFAGTYFHECEITDQQGHPSTLFTGAVTINRSAV